MTDARVWHPWPCIKRLLRDFAGCSAWEATPWRAVRREEVRGF